ncbi:MAG: DUF3048 domain-containing protein [Eubacteriaceae bacterium]|nr:DUF3048 domain-containing protein [Eubacteriaceae bacterium]
MKKFFALALAAVISVSAMTACVKGTENKDKEEPSAPEKTVTEVPKVYYQNPLNGEEQDIDYPWGQHCVAVMVNNIMSDSFQSAWPQRGISDADLIFEMETEGGITRYMAIFRDYTEMPVVGPIRSARDQFVQNMMPYQALYVHDGGSTYAKQMLKDWGWDNRDIYPNSGATFRDTSLYGQRAMEHTEFTSGALITKAVNNPKLGFNTYFEPRNVFNWVKYDQEPRVLNGQDVSEIYWRFSNSYSATMTYHPETGKYTKVHTNIGKRWSNQMVDGLRGNAPVEFDNVLILWTEITRYPDGILSKVDLAFGGVGFYFNGGKVEKVRWLKGQPLEPLRIVSLDGTEQDIEINIGKTYVAFVDLDYFGAFSFDGELVDAYGDYIPESEMEVDEGGQEAGE